MQVLFLGYDRTQTRLIDAMIAAGCEVHHSRSPVGVVQYDLIISFGYRHIVGREVIRGINCPILNLHISYLPFNRGTHPNFWAYFDNTPHGVTIHIMDAGVDTGPILFQKYVDFMNGESTFLESHTTLVRAVEDLFLDHIETILQKKWEAKPQEGQGSMHFLRDLPPEFSGWHSTVSDEIPRLLSNLSHDRFQNRVPQFKPTEHYPISKIRLSRVSSGDSADLFRWRNDPLTQHMSNTPGELNIATHEKWLKDSIDSDTREIFIGRCGGTKIGMVRFDISSKKNRAEVSINLNPALRGQGLSKPLLQEAIKVFHSQHNITLTARIKQSNLVSKRIFCSLGFIQISDSPLITFYELRAQ